MAKQATSPTNQTGPRKRKTKKKKQLTPEQPTPVAGTAVAPQQTMDPAAAAVDAQAKEQLEIQAKSTVAAPTTGLGKKAVAQHAERTASAGRIKQTALDELPKEDDAYVFVPEKKTKGKKGQPQPSAPKTTQEMVADVELRYATSVENATNDRDAVLTEISSGLVQVASTPNGKLLQTTALVELYDLSDGDIKICQVLTDVAATVGGMALARAVANERTPISIGLNCVKLLAAQVDLKNVLAAAKLLTMANSVTFENWLRSLSGADLPLGITFAGDHPKGLEAAAKIFPCWTKKQIPSAHRLVDWLGGRTEPDTEVTWLLSYWTEPEFDQLAQSITTRNNPITAVHEVFAAAGNKFTFQNLAGLCASNMNRLAELVPVIKDAEPGQLSYVRNVVDVGTAITDTLRIALLAESMLFHKTTGFKIVRGKMDLDYGRGSKNPDQQKNKDDDARTGFLLAKFPGKPDGYIHTHWFAELPGGIITSMHVKSDDTVDGVNGTELNKFPALFKLLPGEIAEAQSNAEHSGPAKLVWQPLHS